MLRAIAPRLMQSLIVLLAVSFAVYGLMGLMPGDPIDLMVAADPHLTPADAARLKALYGLDQPLLTRYGHWLTAAVQGDFGYSRLFAKPVLEVLPEALGHTAGLMLAALGLSLLIGLPLGMWAATRPYSKLDYGVNLLAFAGISVPPFWLALVLIFIFAVFLGILPAGGLETGDGGFWSGLTFLVLPVASLTLASIGGHTRYMRAAMIETLRADYIRTARAKGLGEGRVVLRHALRNALLPVVTIIGLDFGVLFSGALITETIFAYPGMGRLIYDAVMGNDFNLALVALLLATAMTLLGNLLADLAYRALDPRIHFREARP
ncbi:ABC transporter permease [Magnetospira thiophila]